jgi:hypothetical protein
MDLLVVSDGSEVNRTMTFVQWHWILDAQYSLRLACDSGQVPGHGRAVCLVQFRRLDREWLHTLKGA